MIRAAIYIRVSTEEQHLHGLSLDAQRDALIEYAKKNDMQIVDVYADEGITARKQLNKRLEFQRLMRDVQYNKIDVILVTKLDRWFRNIKDYYNTQDVLEKHNCNWRTIYENYDTSTAGGRLHINIMLSVNQDECDRTSERIKAVFKHKVENKEVLSGRTAIGYKIENKHLVIDEDGANLVRDIFNYYEKNGSVAGTVTYYASKYGRTEYKSVKAMLSNRLYLGEYKGIKDYCPAIISIKQFNSVQGILSKNRRVQKSSLPNSEYIFSKLLKCACCGNSYAGTRQIRHTGKRGEYLYKTYRCRTRYMHKACENTYSIPEKMLETYLLNNIKPELEKYKVTYQITQKKKKQTDNKKAIEKLKKKCDKLKDLYLDDLIDKETYKNDYESLQRQIDELSNETIQEDVDISSIESLLSLDFNSIYSTLNTLEKRRLWLSVIDYIEVGKNKNEIAIHFL